MTFLPSGNMSRRRILHAAALAAVGVGGLRGLTTVAAPAVAAPVPAATPASPVVDSRICRDEFEREVLRIYRDLTPPQREAWFRMLQRMASGMPTREAGYRMHRELGCTAREARDNIDAVLRRPAAAS